MLQDLTGNESNHELLNPKLQLGHLCPVGVKSKEGDKSPNNNKFSPEPLNGKQRLTASC